MTADSFEASGKLFVGSIASSTSREDLLRLFAPFGPVAEVVVLAERDGRPKFSAFVNMRRRSDALRAIHALDCALTLPNAKKILEVRFASPAGPAAGRLLRTLSTTDAASTAPSSPKTPSRVPSDPSAFSKTTTTTTTTTTTFRVRVSGVNGVNGVNEEVKCENAMTAVLLWVELLEAGVAAELVDF